MIDTFNIINRTTLSENLGFCLIMYLGNKNVHHYVLGLLVTSGSGECIQFCRNRARASNLFSKLHMKLYLESASHGIIQLLAIQIT